MRALPLLLLLLASLLAGPASARQDGPAPRGGDRAERLERWERLSPEQRALLRERFEAWRRMDESERAHMRRRLERLRDVEQRVEHGLPPAVRERLERLAPAERREMLSHHLRDELFERGRRMRGKLPPEVAARLEGAAPEERERLLAELRGSFEREHLGRALRDLGAELELPGAEVDLLLAQPVEVQREKVLELRRAELARRVQRDGLPEFLTADQWRAWAALDDREFFERLYEARGGPRRGEERRSGLRHLVCPDPQWLGELAPLPREERREELQRRLRARALDWLAEHPELLRPGELDELRGLETRALLERLGERGRGEGGEPRRGRHRGREGGPPRSEHGKGSRRPGPDGPPPG